MAQSYVSTTVYTPPPNLAPFSAPLQTFQKSYNSEASLVVGGFIFAYDRTLASPEPRLLLLHRASADAYGDLWDFPGGSCEASDATLVDAVKREVWEETGLRVSAAMDFVGLHTWVEDKKKGDRAWVKFSFIVAVEGSVALAAGFPSVRLADKEHQGFRWASEEEIQASLEGKEGALKFIAMEEIEIAAEAFRRFKESRTLPALED